MTSNPKSELFSKRKLVLIGAGLLIAKLWLQSRLEKHRLKHRDIKIIFYSLIALLFLAVTGWTVLLIKLMDLFVNYFGNTWLAFGTLLAVIVVMIISGWLILKSFVKRLLKKLAAVLLIEKLIF